MDTGLVGKTAVVGGSSSGLGLAVGRALAAEGAHVVLSGRRGDTLAREAARLPSTVGVEVDLTTPGGPAQLVEAAQSRFGPVDVLVLGGGGPKPGETVALSVDDVGAAVHDLLLAQVRLVSLVLPAMRERGWGRIVGIGSSGVQQPLDNLALSNVARSAMAAYLKTLAAEVASDGVTVNMVLPGRIDTERVASLDRAAAERQGVDVADVQKRSRSAIPIGRYGTVEEFAAVVLFLCSKCASYVTGEQIRCDGGLVRSF